MNLTRYLWPLICFFLVTISSSAQQPPARPSADDGGMPLRTTKARQSGHPELPMVIPTPGFWKGSKASKPVGNICKDLPGLKLPLTPAGEAPLQHNLTATIDPECLCIPVRMPRHNASGLPSMVVQNNQYVTFLYFHTCYRPSGNRNKPY